MIKNLKLFLKNIIKSRGPLTKIILWAWSYMSIPWRRFSQRFPIVSSILVVILISAGITLLLCLIGFGLLSIGDVL